MVSWLPGSQVKRCTLRRSGRRVANRGLRMEGEGLHDKAQPLAAGVVLRPGFSAPQSPRTDGNASCAAPLVAGHDGALGNNDSPQRRRPSASPPLLLPRFAAQVQPPNAPMLPSVPRTRGSRARPRSERSVDRRELLLCSAEASRSVAEPINVETRETAEDLSSAMVPLFLSSRPGDGP